MTWWERFNFPKADYATFIMVIVSVTIPAAMHHLPQHFAQIDPIMQPNAMSLMSEKQAPKKKSYRKSPHPKRETGRPMLNKKGTEEPEDPMLDT